MSFIEINGQDAFFCKDKFILKEIWLIILK